MTNVDNALLKQMQKLATSITAMQGTASKDKTNQAAVSFQDMMQQSGGKVSNTQKSEGKDPVEGALKEKVEEGLEEGKLPVQEKEELKPEEMTANPNVEALMNVFRPEIVETEEAPVEAVVAAIPEEAIEEPVMDLQGQAPEMETTVDTSVGSEVELEQQPKDFSQSMTEEAPTEETAVQQQEQKPVEVQKTETAPEEHVGQQTEKPETVEKVEVRTENHEEGEETHGEAMMEETPVFHDAKAVPVKVGESYKTVDTQQPEMEKQIAGNVNEALQNGAERVEIHLAPQNLGSVVIEMTKDTSGVLQVVLHAATPKAEGLLNQHLSGLHNALLGYGHEEVRLEVQRGQEGQEQHFKQADPDGHGQHQQRQQQRQEDTPADSQEFLQKLRLGLFGVDE